MGSKMAVLGGNSGLNTCVDAVSFDVFSVQVVAYRNTTPYLIWIKFYWMVPWNISLRPDIPVFTCASSDEHLLTGFVVVFDQISSFSVGFRCSYSTLACDAVTFTISRNCCVATEKLLIMLHLAIFILVALTCMTICYCSQQFCTNIFSFTCMSVS